MTQPNVNLEVRLEDGTVAQGTFANTPNAPTAGAMGLVWRPGGVFGPGVVTTWAEVAAAVAASPVPLWVWVDSSIAAAVIPGSSGTTDMRGTTRLLSFNWSTASISYTDAVEIQDGATLYRLREIAEGLDVLCDAVTTPSLSFEGPPTIDVFTVRDFARLRTGGSAAVAAIELGAGQSLQFYTRGNVQVEALTASGLFSLTSTSILNWTAFDQLTVNVYASVLITGPAGARFNFIHDLSTLPGLPTALTGFSGTFYDQRLFPAPGTTPYNPAWFALTDIYLDPVAGNDQAAGTISAPLKTMAQVIQRYGSDSPEIPYGQNLTIHQVSAQTAGVDAFFFNPKLSGGGNYTWIATPTARGAAFSPTSITAKVQTAAGNQLILNGNLPAGLARGDIITNTSRGSFAKVISVSAGDATVTQPLNFTAGIFPTLSEDISWSNANTYQASTPLLCNYKNPAPQGCDQTAASANTTGLIVIDGIQIPSLTGSTDDNNFWTFKPLGAVPTLVRCTVNACAQLDFFDAPLEYAFVVGCTFTAGGQCVWGAIVGGELGGQEWLLTNLILDGDVACTGGSLVIYGPSVYVGAAQFPAAVILGSYSGATGLFNEAVYASAIIWGGADIDVAAGSNYQNYSGTTFAATLKVTTLKLDGATTGSSFNAGAANNPYTAGIALTSANLDTGGGAGNPGLQNPRTGSRFAST